MRCGQCKVFGHSSCTDKSQGSNPLEKENVNVHSSDSGTYASGKKEGEFNPLQLVVS